MSLLRILVASLAIIYLTIKLTQWYKRRRRLVECIEKLPGPPIVPYAPLVNHALVMIYLDSVLRHRLGSFVIIYHLISNPFTLFPDTGICRFWLGWKPFVVLFSPENIEQVLNSTSVLNKAEEYRFFEPWIGEGLVTSKRNKWRFRRKILTSAFHFRILNDFLPIMNEEASKLVIKLNSTKYVCQCNELENKSHNGKTIDIVPLVALCTLDTICETAMGVNLNCQDDSNGRQSQYVKALNEVGEMALTRVTRPWLWSDFVFNLVESGRKFNKAKDYMHEFSTQVILERKNEWEKMLSTTQSFESGDAQITFDEVMKSSFFEASDKRLAFLDLMLHQHLVEHTMSIDDIREEVDTFMFAGHDTTAMSISWTIYMLGLHEQIQSELRDELDRVLGSSSRGGCAPETAAASKEKRPAHHSCPNVSAQVQVDDITVEQMRDMKYLDRVIKESLRMWPSIPFVARQMTEDLTVGGTDQKYLIPEGATCVIFTHALHNNPKYYPNPQVFDPDRFLPEKTLGRHPFAYIPFSAGPRNCIGQRFAQMELKVILAKIVRNFYIKTLNHRDKLEVVGELVLRSKNGLKVQLIPRFK